MKHNSCWLPLVACLGMMASAHANTDDKAWKQYLEYSQSRPKVVATKMATAYKIPGESAPDVGSYTSERVVPAEGDKPQWVMVDKSKASANMQKGMRLDMSLAAKFAENPNDVLEPPSSVERVGTEKVGGVEWVILKAQTRLKGSKPPFTAKVWVHPVTGQPLKMEGLLENVPIPGSRNVRFSVSYDQAGAAAVLPKLVSLHYDFSIMFQKGEMDFAQELSGWKPR